MQQQNTNNTSTGRRQTPGRRRQSRNTANAPAPASHQRNYASENDAADLSKADVAFRKEMSDSPRTPRKSSPSHPSSNAKSRTGNKQRSKNATASPIPVNPSRHTPPPPMPTMPMSAKASSIAAFAGATFHASPAPSSLPIPSFVAKAMPDSPGAAGSRRPISQEPSPPPSDSEMPTPAPKSAVELSREESPLDIFFRADRAEKEARRTSSSNGGVSLFGSFSPPSQPISPLRAGPSAAKGGPFQQGRPQFQRNASAGSSPIDGSGASTNGMGPAFSTPYYERIKAARSVDKQPRAAPEIVPQQQQSAVDRGEALKNFLFAGHKQPSPTMTSPPAGASLLPAGARPPRSYAQNMYGAPYLHEASDRRSANLLAFEDDLRRMLKLDSPLSIVSKPPALTNAHTS